MKKVVRKILIYVVAIAVILIAVSSLIKGDGRGFLRVFDKLDTLKLGNIRSLMNDE